MHASATFLIVKSINTGTLFPFFELFNLIYVFITASVPFGGNAIVGFASSAMIQPL